MLQENAQVIYIEQINNLEPRLSFKEVGLRLNYSLHVSALGDSALLIA